MRKSQVSYDDTIDRKEAMAMWRDLGNNDILHSGPKYKVDIITDNYDIEIGRTSWTNNLFDKSEWRLEKRKLHFWDNDKPVHFINFNKDRTEALITYSGHIKDWKKKYNIEYRYCDGWPRDESYFLCIPLHEQSKMLYIKKVNGAWTRQKK